jgi:hypothetical protein
MLKHSSVWRTAYFRKDDDNTATEKDFDSDTDFHDTELVAPVEELEDDADDPVVELQERLAAMDFLVFTPYENNKNDVEFAKAEKFR